MNREFKIQKLKDQSGFTLIEMLVVVIILGILAMIIIPQITVSTDDARLNTLQTNLSSLRSAVELYYHQHNNTYPGAVKTDGTGTATVATDLPAAFIEQLTRYTNRNGQTSTDLDRTNFPYGPYLKGGLPTNPYNDLDDVLCDITTVNVTTRDSSATNNGWKFYVRTGVLIPGDQGNHDTL